MTKNKKIALSVIIISIVLIFFIVFFLKVVNNQKEMDNKPIQENTKIKKENRYLTIDERGMISDKINGFIIYDPKQDYADQYKEKIEINQLLENNNNELNEYLKYFFWAFSEQTKTSFDEEDIAILVSLTLNAYLPNTSNDVKQIAKRYFGIQNYELPTGTYEIPNYGNYTVIKVDNYYIRSFVESCDNSDLEITTRELTNIKRTENKVIAYFNKFKGSFMMGGCYAENSSSEEKDKCLLGQYIIELIYNSEAASLIVNEFKYIEK